MNEGKNLKINFKTRESIKSTKKTNINPINKRGFSQIWNFVIGMGIVLLLVIVIYVWLGSTNSSFREFITKIFG